MVHSMICMSGQPGTNMSYKLQVKILRVKIPDVTIAHVKTPEVKLPECQNITVSKYQFVEIHRVQLTEGQKAGKYLLRNIAPLFITFGVVFKW